MKSEKGTSYLWVFLLWIACLIAIALIAYVSGIQTILYLFALIMPIGAVAPLVIQLKTKRRLSGLWCLGKHLDEDPVTYKFVVILNFLIVCWLVFWSFGAVRQLAAP